MTPDPRSVDRPVPRTQRMLDLFAFPSDTRGWFRMLVVAACLVGLNVGFLTAQRIHGVQDADARERLESRIAGMMKGRDLRELSPEEIAALGRKLVPITRELLAARLPQLGSSLLPVLLLLGGAAAIYLDHPRRYRRRHRSQALAEGDAPTVVRDVNRWAAKLRLPPLTLEHRRGHGNEAQIFGLRGREVLMFHGDPPLLERVWSETPKVITLHELGHVKNNDAQAREKSKAVWIALFGLLLLASCVLVGVSVQTGWRIAAMLLLVFAIWTRLVRTFELYADRRVASWGWESALQRLLRLRGTRKFLHPSNHRRRKVLAEPAHLFRVSPILAVVTGALLAILTVNVIFPVLEIAFDASLAASTGLWSKLAPFFVSLPSPLGKQLLLICVAVLNLGQILLVFLVPLAVLSHLVAGTLGAQVQRETVADLATGNPRTWGYARLLWPAVLLALGVEGGFFIAPFNSGLQSPLGGRILILWLAGLTGFTWLWLAYVRALTRFILGMHVGASLSNRLRRVVSVSSVALLTVLYWPAGFARLAPRISLWPRLARWNAGADPKEIFVYSVVMTGIVLATFAISVYIAGAGASLATLVIRLWRGNARCPTCDELAGFGFAVGRSCAYCNEPLALWAYAEAPNDPTRPSTGGPG